MFVYFETVGMGHTPSSWVIDPVRNIIANEVSKK
jgi:hypothetical protein